MEANVNDARAGVLPRRIGAMVRNVVGSTGKSSETAANFLTVDANAAGISAKDARFPPRRALESPRGLRSLWRADCCSQRIREVIVRNTPLGIALSSFLLVGLAACDKDSPVEPAKPCAFTVSASSLSFGANGGSASVSINTASQCAWTATSDRGWMTIGSGASGTGNGAVTVTVTANSGEATRTGALTIAGQTVSVEEAGLGACTVDISPSTASYGKDAATGSLTVTAPAHCTWTATSNASWLRITGGSPGTGASSVAYAIDRNTGAEPRSGAITVADRTFTLNQAGDPPLICDYSVTPVTFPVCMSVGFELVATLTTNDGCSWTVQPDADWLTLLTPAAGSGPSQVRFRVGDNYDAPRQGRMMVRWPTPTAGQNLLVSQAGCRYAVTVPAFTVVAAGGTNQFDVLQQSDPTECGGPLQNGCLWSAVSDVPWITVTSSMPRRGDDRVVFSVAPNTGTTPRSGTITVRDQTVRVTQNGI